jgi:hypothetical protein
MSSTHTSLCGPAAREKKSEVLPRAPGKRLCAGSPRPCTLCTPLFLIGMGGQGMWTLQEPWLPPFTLQKRIHR